MMVAALWDNFVLWLISWNKHKWWLGFMISSADWKSRAFRVSFWTCSMILCLNLKIDARNSSFCYFFPFTLYRMFVLPFPDLQQMQCLFLAKATVNEAKAREDRWSQRLAGPLHAHCCCGGQCPPFPGRILPQAPSSVAQERGVGMGKGLKSRVLNKQIIHPHTAAITSNYTNRLEETNKRRKFAYKT